MEIPLNFSVDSGEPSSRSGRLHSSGFSMARSINEENSDSVGNTLSGTFRILEVGFFLVVVTVTEVNLKII